MTISRRTFINLAGASALAARLAADSTGPPPLKTAADSGAEIRAVKLKERDLRSNQRDPVAGRPLPG